VVGVIVVDPTNILNSFSFEINKQIMLKRIKNKKIMENLKM
jgi:hypothetical protein